MDNLSIILQILLAHLLAVSSPGPDFVVVLKNSLNYSRKAGIFTAFGIGAGIVIHVAYTFLGLGVIIQKTPILFTTIKYLGSIYIFYIGVMSFKSVAKSNLVKAANKKIITNSKAFKNGFFTNVLNPKVPLFFIALFTVVLKPETSSFLLVLIGVLIVMQTTLWFIVVSYFFTQVTIQKKYFQYQNTINKFFGIVLILLAIKVAFY